MVVTRPKDARFLHPAEPPGARRRRAAAVRVLAFSPDGPVRIERAEVQRGDGGGGVDVLGPAVPQPGAAGAAAFEFLVPWDPAPYARAGGVHALRVTAVDARGRRRTRVVPFSLDGSARPMGADGGLAQAIMAGPLQMFTFLLGAGVAALAALVGGLAAAPAPESAYRQRRPTNRCCLPFSGCVRARAVPWLW